MPLLLTSYVTLLALCATWADLVTAQAFNVTFVNDFLGTLDSMGFTNFTTLVAQVTNDGATSFATYLSEPSTPKTLFVPDNHAFAQPGVNFFAGDFFANNTQFLSSLLLYHLLDGTWTEDQLTGSLPDSIMPTFLQGNGIVFLEDNSPQMMVGAVTSNGFEVLNQQQPTFVLQTLQYEHVTVQVINAIIGIPGPFTATINAVGLAQLATLQAAAGFDTDLDTTLGLTVFAPLNDAFTAAHDEIVNATATSLFTNHIIVGQSVRHPDFRTGQFTSESHLNYTFAQDPANQRFTVTLNGVTANIVRTDFLVSNGVIHILDGVLFNTTVSNPLAAPAVSDTEASSSPTPPTSSLPSATSSTQSLPPSAVGIASSTPSRAVPTTNTTNSTSSSGLTLSAGPIIGIVVVTLSLFFCSIIAFMVWRARRRAKMGWHISRRPRWSSFDLDIRDREAHVIDPFVPHGGARGNTKWESEFLPPEYANAGRSSLSQSESSLRSYRKAPPIIDTFELQPKSSPISPPGVAVVRQDGDRHYENPQRKGTGDSQLRVTNETATTPPRDPAVLKALMEKFPQPSPKPMSISPPTLGGDHPDEQVRPPTYYSTARSLARRTESSGLG